jgi:hypothetical protein
MSFGRWLVGLVAVQVRAPQTFTIMLLSVAEPFLSKPFEYLLHPAQKLLLEKMGTKVTKQFNHPAEIMLMYNVTLLAGFLKEILT